MASEVLCLYLSDDETLLSALKDAIESDDSPELVRLQPFNRNEPGGLWVRDNLCSSGELEKAKAEGRYYCDDRSTFRWMWSPDEPDPKLQQAVKDLQMLCIVIARAKTDEKRLEKAAHANRIASAVGCGPSILRDDVSAGSVVGKGGE